jgi:hypothetical protein
MSLLQMQKDRVHEASGEEWVQRQHDEQEQAAQRKKNEEAMEAAARNRAIMQQRTQIQYGHEEGEREVLPMGVGRDETQKFLERRKGIMERLNQLSAQPQSEAATLAREIELQNHLYETQVSLRRRSFETEREITQLKIDQRREAEHALLGAGPGEMLRMLAAGRMAAGGRMGMGQFMGFSPDMRRDVARWDTRFDPRMMDLALESRRDPWQSFGAFTREQDRLSAERLANTRKLQDITPAAGSRSDYEAAAKTMNVTADKVTVIGTTIIVNGQNAGLTPPATAKTGAAPKLSQAGGLGGGSGHMLVA